MSSRSERSRRSEMAAMFQKRNQRGPGKTDVIDIHTPTVGGKLDMNISEVRNFMHRSKRMKGFSQTVASGTGVRFEIDLSGDARLFLGWSLLPPDTDPALAPENVSLTINNFIVVEQVHPLFYSQQFMDDEYYFIPEPLSGTDSITVTWDNTQLSQTWQIVIYYI